MNKYFIFFISQIIYASSIISSLSYQGYTGIINTPNAQVIDNGAFYFHFDNQFNNSLRGYDVTRKESNVENYIFGVGFFKNFEIQGRISEVPFYHRDLSANVKWKLPFSFKYFPDIALGIQDLGGAANFYDNHYIVADKTFFYTRISLGYGIADSALAENKKRMDGIFGAVEIQPLQWLSFMAENDTKENFLGVKFSLPQKFLMPFTLNTLWSINLTDRNKASFAINLSIPLYEAKKDYDGETLLAYQQTSVLKNNITRVVKDKKDFKPPRDLKLFELSQLLFKLGFENITIKVKDKTLYIKYENNIFTQNDIDAMGVIVGLLTTTSEYTHFILEQTKSKITTLRISGDLTKAKEFYKDPSFQTKYLFATSLRDVSKENITGYKEITSHKNDSSLKPKIEFSPKVITFLGNEFGLFTYKLWLRNRVILNLAQGLDLSGSANIHIYDSQPEDHRYDSYLKLYEDGSYLESLMLHKSDAIQRSINTISFGVLEQNYFGIADELMYKKENQTLGMKLGYFKQFKDGDPIKEYWFGKFQKRSFYLLSYNYFFPEYDTFFEINGGKYWNQDKGFDVKLKRYFLDVACYLTYSQSKADTFFSEKIDKHAGIGIEIPLTLRYIKGYNAFQLKGINNFDYHVLTTVGREDGSNTVLANSNTIPNLNINIKNYFYNNNRLQISYIKEHLFRFHDAYKKYAIGTLDSFFQNTPKEYHLSH